MRQTVQQLRAKHELMDVELNTRTRNIEELETQVSMILLFIACLGLNNHGLEVD